MHVKHTHTPARCWQAEGKWRNVRNVPGVLRHLLNPDSPDFRPELQAAWEQADKKQRDAILAMQVVCVRACVCVCRRNRHDVI
jgi:hypothetical protein